MYTLTFESGTKLKNASLKLKNLEDIFQETNNKYESKPFELADVLNKLNYGLTILEPKEDDFLFIYSNKTFWNYFKPDLNKYLIGRRFSEVFPQLINLTDLNLLTHIFNKTKRLDSTIKLYKEDKLVKVWSQTILRQKNSLYFYFNDQTELYLEKEKERVIFDEASFPKLQINNEYNIININKAFTDLIGYTIEDLKELQLDDLSKSYNSNIPTIDNFSDSLNLIFNKKLKSTSAEVELINKNNSYSWFDCFMRLISDDTIQIGFHDSTNYKKEEINDGKLFEYFTDLQKISNTAISLRIGNYVKISPEIYDILESPNEIEHDFTDSPIYNYTLPGEDLKIRRVLNSLSENKTGKCIYNIQSGKGNLKFLKTIFNVRYHNNEKIILGFTQDITDIVQSQKDAIQVKNDFRFTNDAHNMVLVESENNEYNYTSQIYKILKIKPEDYPNTIPLMHKFTIPEDKEKFNQLFINLTPTNNVLDKIIRVKDNEGNLKYIYCQNKGVFDDDGIISQYIGLMLDITEETLSQKSAMTLKKNLERVQDISKIVIISYKNNEITYTDEIYNILEVNPEDCPESIDLVKYFTSKEDKKVLREKLDNLTPINNTFESYNEILTLKNNRKILHTFVDGRFTNDGELESIVGLVQDVTIASQRQKKLEQLVEDKKILL